MRVHILGICGTFMGGVAAIAKAAGHEVSGSDQNVYPPMSTQLEQLGIRLEQGYDQRHVDPDLDCVVVGNALSRGKPVVEALLDSGLPYYSGPQWLAESVLRDKWVLAVSGTHGKTTTTSMLAWILEYAGLDPGFLIGGIPRNFDISARLGGSKYFVVEADEYDTAFFDKRAKFVHYRPRTLVINNIEYDHADIYPDVDAILWQFHQLVRTVPGNGLIVANGRDANVDKLRARGVWTPVETFSAHGEADWTAAYESIGERSSFGVKRRGDRLGSVLWQLLGEHNLENALAALAAALHVGVPADVALAALGEFSGVKRRLEKRGEFGGVALFEDFAHHPTAIATTLAGLRSLGTAKRIVAVMEPRSNTMRMGVHRDTLAASFAGADRLFVLGGDDSRWDVAAAFAPLGAKASVAAHVDELLAALLAELRPGDHVVLMSNGGFQGLPLNLQRALEQRARHGGA
jgi:UDP-N-acetylmuramate: L-alanyl-gamma-D-glutamyl-meso-diaminopimelate ligase